MGRRIHRRYVAGGKHQPVQLGRPGCPTDGRGAVAVLTEKGAAALRDAAPGHVRGVRRHLFDQLGATQQRSLRRISDAVLGHLEQERSDAER